MVWLIGYKIEIVCLFGTLPTILQHCSHTMKSTDPLLLPDVTLQCRMYLAGKVMRLQKDFDPVVQSIKILCELFKDIFQSLFCRRGFCNKGKLAGGGPSLVIISLHQIYLTINSFWFWTEPFRISCLKIRTYSDSFSCWFQPPKSSKHYPDLLRWIELRIVICTFFGRSE